ncbi:hypothetical protein Tco_1329660 [Tanacetum coccineum]
MTEKTLESLIALCEYHLWSDTVNSSTVTFKMYFYIFFWDIIISLKSGFDGIPHLFGISHLMDFSKNDLAGMALARAKVLETQVMAAPIISISSDSSEESVGSHAPRVILFGAIPAIIPIIPEVPIVPADPIVAPEVGTVSVVSPTGVLDLVDYSSSSDSDPSEDSLPPVPDLPLVSPSGSSSHDTLAPLSEFPLAPIVAPPRIRRRSATLIRPGEAIPFGRPYRTHSNGPRRLLTARKRVRPIPARRLAWRRVSHHSSDRHSSPDSSSSSSPSDHSLSGHTPPDTTDADSSTPQRFVH